MRHSTIQAPCQAWAGQTHNPVLSLPSKSLFSSARASSGETTIAYITLFSNSQSGRGQFEQLPPWPRPSCLNLKWSQPPVAFDENFNGTGRGSVVSPPVVKSSVVYGAHKPGLTTASFLASQDASTILHASSALDSTKFCYLAATARLSLWLRSCSLADGLRPTSPSPQFHLSHRVRVRRSTS